MLGVSIDTETKRKKMMNYTVPYILLRNFCVYGSGYVCECMFE